jgi:hypothetical protein
MASLVSRRDAVSFRARSYEPHGRSEGSTRHPGNIPFRAGDRCLVYAHQRRSAPPGKPLGLPRCSKPPAEGPGGIVRAEAEEPLDARDEPDRRGVLARLPVPDSLRGHAEVGSHVALPKPEVQAPALELLAKSLRLFRIAPFPGFFAT